MRFIFLDIDGVLNRSDRINGLAPSGVRGIEDALAENLAYLVRQTQAEIILTSDWKIEWSPDPDKCSEDARYLNEKMAGHGLCIVGKTYDMHVFDEYYACRGAGIRRFLDKQKEVEGYVVLDDHDFMDFGSEIREHFVKIKSWEGLTREKADEALQILNTQISGQC